MLPILRGARRILLPAAACYYYSKSFQSMPWDDVIHRIGEVFNHTIHLCRRGTSWRAQNQFKQLYDNYEEFLEEATRQVLLDARHGVQCYVVV